MTHYGWPGNVRELRNICERLIVLSDTTEIGLREIQMLKIFRKKEGLLPGTETPVKEQALPETEIMYANLKPRKEKAGYSKGAGGQQDDPVAHGEDGAGTEKTVMSVYDVY